MSKYEVHPAATIFPMMTEEEYEGLKQDIKDNGQEDPIMLWRGKVLDGRNRLLACEELGRIPQVAKLSDDTDPWKYVLSHNLHRRHLTTSQRAMVATKLATLRNGSNQHSKEGASKEAPSQNEAAEQLGVGRATVQRAKVVQEHGSASVNKAVEQGKLPVAKAAQLVKAVPDKREQNKILAGGKDAIDNAIDANDDDDDIIETKAKVDNQPEHLIPRIKAAAQSLTNLKRDLKVLQAQRGGEWIPLQDIYRNLDLARYEISKSAFTGICPKCKGKGNESCAVCKGYGFICEARQSFAENNCK